MPHIAYEMLRWLYLATLIATCFYAVVAGGQDERYGASIQFVASIASWPAVALAGRAGWTGTQDILLAVDVVTLAAFVRLAISSDRWWPMWVAGFQLDAVLTHITKFVAPSSLPHGYALLQGFWAYPLMVALVVGTADRRRHCEQAR